MRCAPEQRQFDAAQRLVFLEVGIETVERDGEAFGRLEIQSTDHRGAFQLDAVDVRLRPTDDLRRGVDVGIAPGVETLGLRRRVHVRDAEHDADCVIGELIDIDARSTPAGVRRAGVELAIVGIFAANCGGDDLLTGFERADGLEVDGARQALRHQTGIGRLVDHHLAEDFRRILVEFDRAVVRVRHLFAAVEQRRREIGGETADADDLRAAVEALRRQAGQAADRVGDRVVRQLADVFGRYRFNDAIRQLLVFKDGAQRATIAGDDNRFFGGGCCGSGGLGHYRCGAEQQRRRGTRGQQQSSEGR